MITRLINAFKKPVVETPKVRVDRPRQISTELAPLDSFNKRIEELWAHTFKNSVTPELQSALDAAEKMPAKTSFAMDNQLSIKASWSGNQLIPPAQLAWYASQTFIGYQLCAILAQQWLISKACLMPAEDAIRNGYEITVNDGIEVDSKILAEIRNLDIKFNVNYNCIQFIQQGRIFGIRIAMFKVESSDKDYYYKPFNIDGVTPGSYKGISQIDPYWVTPQLDTEAAGDPSSIHFYEPTWWNIAGKLVHRTHLVIYRTEEVPDILKPTYIYGGIPIPQKIAERVYAAERTANEAPLLALTKRTDVINVDLAQAIANEPDASTGAPGFVQRIQQWVFNRDNYGVKVIGLEEKMEQFDTSLTDLDAVIMTQFQLVSAAANVPGVKLLGTTPKGFNATGEYEEASYHELLESLQTHAASPLINRHHALLIRSEITPNYQIEFTTEVAWKQLDAMTSKELAELNASKAETDTKLIQAGAIDGADIRQRLINDPESGYSGLSEEMPEQEILTEPEENGDL